MPHLWFGNVLLGHHVREAVSRSRCVVLELVLDHGRTSEGVLPEMAGMIRAKESRGRTLQRLHFRP